MKIDPNVLPLSFAGEFSDGFCSLSVSQLGEDLYINKFFEKSPPGFYLDIGAFHPKRLSNTYLLRKYMGWKGIHVDGNPDTINQFKAAAPDFINLHAAVDEVEQEVEFVVYRGAAHSTMDEQRKEFNAKLDVRTKLKMKTVRIEAIIDTHVPAGTEVNFINIDVEGRDLHSDAGSVAHPSLSSASASVRVGRATNRPSRLNQS